jgi:adenine deaminase
MSEPVRIGLVDVAMGYEPADRVVVNGRLVDVNTGTVRDGEGIAIKGARIAAVGDVDYTRGDATEVIDAGGRYVTPGLVDPHLHQWHTYTNSTVFAAGNLLHGTTAVADGFYGHAIVTGARSVRFFLEELERTPVKPLFLVPTLCYTQNRFLGLPNSPQAPTIEDLFEMLDWPQTVGVEETGYELLLNRDRRDRGLFELFDAALRRGKIVMGHGAGLPDDRAVNGFVGSGVMNNHELIAAGEAQRQAELGMISLIREGASCADTRAVSKAVTENGAASRAFSLCPDVITTDALFDAGQQDECIRAAVRNGIPPITAIQMSTIQPAEIFRVNHDMGLIAAGRYADLVFLDDLVDFSIDRVMANGVTCVEGGQLVWAEQQPEYPRWMYETMRIDRPLEPRDFEVPAPNGADRLKVRAIVVQDGLLESEEGFAELGVANGNIEPSSDGRIVNKIAMIDRIHGTGEIGVGFVTGFDLKDGAIGSSANVFNQNIVVVGASESDMAVAANEIVAMGGGFVAVRNGELVASFPTPLNGLVSDLSTEKTVAAIERLLAAWREMGCRLKSPQINLEFVTLVTIPRLRISTKGLVMIEGDNYRRVQTVV